MRTQNRSPRVWLLRSLTAMLTIAALRIVIVDIGAIDAQAHDLGPLVRVVIARRDLQLGSAITSADIAVVDRHTSQVPTHVIHSTRVVVGKIVRIPVVADSPLQVGNFFAPSPNGQSTNRQTPNAQTSVVSGYRAIRVKDHSGLIPAPGSVVDLIASFETPNAQDTDPSTTRRSGGHDVVARGAIVMAENVSDNATGPPNNLTSATQEPGIMVLVKDSEAEQVAFASAFGVLTVVLAPPEEACCASK